MKSYSNDHVTPDIVALLSAETEKVAASRYKVVVTLLITVIVLDLITLVAIFS